MTREEQIEQAAKKYAVSNDNDPNLTWARECAFMQGAVWADEHPDLYSVTRKAVEREKEYLIDKVCKWLNENMADHTLSYEDYEVHSVEPTDYSFKKDFIEAFRKAMEE